MFESVLWARVMVLAVNLLWFPFMMVLCSGVIQASTPACMRLQESMGQRAGSVRPRHLPICDVFCSSAAHHAVCGAFTTSTDLPAYRRRTCYRGFRGAVEPDILISWVFKMSFDTLNSLQLCLRNIVGRFLSSS